MDEFLHSVDKRDKTKISSWIILLEENGYKLKRPYTDTAKGKIKYLRIDKGAMCYRLFYFFDGNRIILTNGYKKKVQKLDKKEIEKAEKYRLEYYSRRSSSK